MFRLIPIFLFLSITCFSQETQKRILFRGDSIWYAGENQALFSSTNKGASWDTVFAKRNPQDTVFFQGVLDTATNVFIADQRTLFVFGWDGTMLRKTILFSSADGGKTWNKNAFYSSTGILGVKYLHKNAAGDYFLYKRRGYYVYSTDSGKTWEERSIVTSKFGCFDERVIIKPGGEMIIGFSRDKECKTRTMMHSLDGGKTWQKK
jgi:photosystem II stability/assembly factor-like uncharacterized protein